jgi:hypothetical protein
VPFVLVVTRELVPVEETMPCTTLPGGRLAGSVDRSFEPGALERFVAKGTKGSLSCLPR